jgi:hypothetical protein
MVNGTGSVAKAIAPLPACLLGRGGQRLASPTVEYQDGTAASPSLGIAVRVDGSIERDHLWAGRRHRVGRSHLRWRSPTPGPLPPTARSRSSRASSSGLVERPRPHTSAGFYTPARASRPGKPKPKPEQVAPGELRRQPVAWAEDAVRSHVRTRGRLAQSLFVQVVQSAHR